MAEMVFTREPDDPMSLRVSIGGWEPLGYYFVFRGDPADVLIMLEAIVKEARTRLRHGDYEDKRGRPQG